MTVVDPASRKLHVSNRFLQFYKSTKHSSLWQLELPRSLVNQTMWLVPMILVTPHPHNCHCHSWNLNICFTPGARNSISHKLATHWLILKPTNNYRQLSHIGAPSNIHYITCHRFSPLCNIYCHVFSLKIQNKHHACFFLWSFSQTLTSHAFR